MQWTDGNGGPYGEDPYGGVVHPYAYGYDYGSGATTDAATAVWDPAPLAPCGDVLTVPPPGLDPSSHQQDLDIPESEAVFVDSSGRRQRRVLRAARLLLIPAGCYVALLISAMLGGPTLSAPFVPQPDPAHHPVTHHPSAPRAAAPESSSGTRRSAGSTTPTLTQKSSHPTAAPTASAGGAKASTSGPTSTASSAPAPAATHAAAPGPTPRGRAVGSSHKPVK